MKDVGRKKEDMKEKMEKSVQQVKEAVGSV
jgi:hypothetical protein